MKNNLHLNIHKKMTSQDRLYGTTTMGARGQVVIPAEARKELKLKPGDQLLVMGRFNKALGLMKTEDLAGIIQMIVKHAAGSPMEGEIKDYIKKMFGNIKPDK